MIEVSDDAFQILLTLVRSHRRSAPQVDYQDQLVFRGTGSRKRVPTPYLRDIYRVASPDWIAARQSQAGAVDVRARQSSEGQQIGSASRRKLTLHEPRQIDQGIAAALDVDPRMGRAAIGAQS